MPNIHIRVESVTRTVQNESVQLVVFTYDENSSGVNLGNAFFTVTNPDDFGKFIPGDVFDLTPTEADPPRPIGIGETGTGGDEVSPTK